MSSLPFPDGVQGAEGRRGAASELLHASAQGERLSELPVDRLKNGWAHRTLGTGLKGIQKLLMYLHNL